MSEKVVVESTEPDFDYKRLFLAAVRKAGGTVTITSDDYINTPEVAILASDAENSMTFQVIAEVSGE
jgi:hypothetical protein